MILFSLNIRGVGGLPKQLALKRVLHITNPDLILLQETMESGDKARSFFNKIKLGWMICTVDAVGLSGGLLAAWNPLVFKLCPSVTSLGILLSGNIRGLEKNINIINCYGPYSNRMDFWDRAVTDHLLELKT